MLHDCSPYQAHLCRGVYTARSLRKAVSAAYLLIGVRKGVPVCKSTM